MRYLKSTINYVIEYSGFPAVLEGISLLLWTHVR